MAVVHNNLPGDPLLIDKIVYELKSQGIFDQFRKECIADVDTKPAYQNLRQRVEGSVSGFLSKQTWSSDMNKNQLREMLRKNIYESGFLETGVERIVDQVVNPKMNSVFLPKVTEVVYKFLGIEKPTSLSDKKEVLKLTFDNDNLLPTDLEAVSPESEKKFDIDVPSQDDSKIDEDESPPFEPLEEKPVYIPPEENSVDSHLSGISGLMSHDSNHSQEFSKPLQMEISNQDSILSKQSSEGRLSIVMSDDNDTKMEICEEVLPKTPRITDIKVKDFEFNQEIVTNNNTTSPAKKTENKSEEKSKSNDKSSKSHDRHKSRHHESGRSDKKDDKDKKTDKDRKEHKDKHSSSRDKGRDKDRKDSKSSSSKGEKDKSEKSDKERSKSSSSSSTRHSSSNKDKEKDKNSNSSSSKKEVSSFSAKDRGDYKDKSKSSSSSSKDKDPKHKDSTSSSSSRSKSDNKSSSKHESSSSSSRSDKHKKDDKYKSDRRSSSSKSKDKDKDKEKKDSKKDKKESSKDDHFSSKKRSDRRSTDRDSNDGQSGLKSSSSSFDSSSASSQNQNKSSQDSSNSNSNSNNGSGDSGNSDGVEEHITNNGAVTILNDKLEALNEVTITNTVRENEIKIPPALKLIKPKFASNIHEAKRLMKIRKQLALLEKQNFLDVSRMLEKKKKITNDNDETKNKTKNNKVKNHSAVHNNHGAKPAKESTPEPLSPPLKSSVVSAATWDALEAKLHESLNYTTSYEAPEVPEEVVASTTSLNKEDCSFLEPDDIERSKRFMKHAEKSIKILEDAIDWKPSGGSTSRTLQKATPHTLNRVNNVASRGVKRKFSDFQADVKNNNKKFNTHHIEVHENFSLPLSPAESDNSIDKKSDTSESSYKSLKKAETELVEKTKKSVRGVAKTQRYSSEDLYKPRPVFGGSRRRNGRNLGVD